MAARIAVVGTGLVGRAWNIVFARAGLETVLFDPVQGAAHSALEAIEAQRPDLAQAERLRGHAPEQVLARLSLAQSLAEALEGASHVQESAPERVEVKQALYAQMDGLAPPPCAARFAL